MSHLLRTALRTVQRSKSSSYFCSYVPSTTNETRQPQDLIMQNLRSASSTSELLNAVSRYLQVMNHKHLLQVLRSLLELNRDERSYSSQDVMRNPTFGSVCQALKRNACILEPNDYIEAFKILSSLKVPIDSVIQQSMLQLIRNNINDFNLRQIMFIDFLLTKYDDRNPLVDALKLALPLVFQIRLPLELDREDVRQLNQMLTYACVHGLPDRCINNIITGLLMHSESFDEHTAKSIVWSLTYIKVTPDVYPTRIKLLHNCYITLVKTMNRFKPDQILRLSARLRSRLMEKHMEFYYEPLFDAIAEYVVANSLDLETSLLIARNVTKVRHVNIALLEYLSDLAYENCDKIATLKPNIILSFIHSLSNANFTLKAEQWSTIKKEIPRNNILQNTKLPVPHCKIALELASLGLYDMDFMSKFFSPENMKEYFSREENALDYMQIILLHEAAKSFCDGYNLTPPEDILRQAVDNYPIIPGNGLIEEALTRALGGPEYHARNVQLPSGIIVDEIIAFQNGMPIAIQGANKDGKTSLQQLKIPESALVVCIVKLHKICYALNSDRLRGTFQLLIDVLEQQGYPTVPVNFHAWVQMPTAEQAQYLMRDIDDKCKNAGRARVAAD